VDLVGSFAGRRWANLFTPATAHVSLTIDIRAFFVWASGPAGPGRFRLQAFGANGQPAFGLHGRAADGSGFSPQAIQVLTLRLDRIARLHGFVRPDLFSALGLPARLSG